MEAGHPHLERAPLRGVICQLRFPVRLGFDDQDMRPIQFALEETFPRVEKLVQQVVQISPEQVQQVQSPEAVYRLLTEDADWTITVASSFVALEAVGAHYSRFADFRERWSDVLDAVTEPLGITRCERIGLRYVNQIELEDTSLEGLRAVVSEALLSPIGRHELMSRPLIGLQELRFATDHGAYLLRHGIEPLNEQLRAYLIDIDVYDERPHRLEREEHLEQLSHFSDIAWTLFRWSVTEEQFAAFNPEEGNDAAA